MYEANVYYYLSDQSVCYWTVANSIRNILNTILKSDGIPYYLTIVTDNGEQVPPHHIGYLLKLLYRKKSK